MSPHVATIVCLFGILGLFVLYRDPKARVSTALWLPTIWIILAGSRMVSQWLQPKPQVAAAAQLLEGNPLDRLVLTTLLLAGIFILFCRGRRLIGVLKMNAPILLFFLYGAISTMWSDYPGVAAKRWIKATGDLVMILIILTDRNRTEAIKRVISRVGFILMPLSMLLIKYYPSWGSVYSLEEGMTTYTGAATTKNMLGLICLVVGLGCVWLLIRGFHSTRRRNRQMLAQGILLAMIVWLLVVANSMTSLACFSLGTALIIVVKLFGGRRPAHVHFIVASMLSVAALMLLMPDVFVSAIHALGRNTTLTGRTVLWKALIGMDTHPWLGVGFESFWLGSRLNHLWTMFVWYPNEAHNGYLEVFLNLGWVGLGLLAWLIVTGYRNVVAAFRRDPDVGSLKLGYFAVALAYSFTEAGFRMLDPMWMFFLLVITAVPIAAARDEQVIRPNPPVDSFSVESPEENEQIYAGIR